MTTSDQPNETERDGTRVSPRESPDFVKQHQERQTESQQSNQGERTVDRRAQPTRTAGFPALVLTAIVSLAAGAWLAPLDRAGADVRTAPTPQAFKSGAARSETVLREISTTLKTMDRRLERIERQVVNRKVE